MKTLGEQVEHVWHEFSTRRDDLDKHIYLRALQDRNETLFYRVLREHIPETLPIIYTPTVGEACQRFGEIYRRPRGLFVSYADRDCLAEVISNRPQRDVDVIVVTDGQRILGLGDQGIGGMGIPIGKLSLYTLIGGIDPARTLPIVLDVGTDNVELLDDPHYLGWRHRRIDDDDYYAFIDKFVAAVHQELPNVLLQWEDFATVHAQPILARYRDKLLTFNDDIQGTAAVALGALHGAAKVAGRPLSQQQVVMLGAGSAGIGVLDMIRQQMVTEGLSESQHWNGSGLSTWWACSPMTAQICPRHSVNSPKLPGGWRAGACPGRPNLPTSCTRSTSVCCSGCPLPPALSLRTSCARWPARLRGRSFSRCPIRPAAPRRVRPSWTIGLTDAH